MYRAGARLRSMIVRFRKREAEIDKLAEALNTIEERQANDDLIYDMAAEFYPHINRLAESILNIKPRTREEASVCALAMCWEET